jgi:hypothetical protein
MVNQEWPIELQKENNKELKVLKRNEKFLDKLQSFGITDIDFINNVLGGSKKVSNKIESFDVQDENNIAIKYSDGREICIQRQKIKRTNPESIQTEEEVFVIINLNEQHIGSRNYKLENRDYDNERSQEDRYIGKYGKYNKDDE